MFRSKAADSFLAKYPPEVQEIAHATRKLLYDVFPDIEETVQESTRLIGYRYGPGYKGLLCTLIPSQKGVKLGIFRALELSDPRKLLQGEGKVHRHVPLSRVDDLRQVGLRPLLRQALVVWQRRNRASA